MSTKMQVRTPNHMLRNTELLETLDGKVTDDLW